MATQEDKQQDTSPSTTIPIEDIAAILGITEGTQQSSASPFTVKGGPPSPIEIGAGVSNLAGVGTEFTDVGMAYARAYQEAWKYLTGFTNKDERLSFLKTLRNNGFGSAAEIEGGGLSQGDIARVQEFFVYAWQSQQTVPQNVNLNEAYKGLSERARLDATGMRRRTPVADVDSVFKEVMRQRLGRGPKAEEVAKFREAYGRMEAGMNAPSVQTAAEQQVVSTNPEEAAATRFAGVASMFQQMLRGA